MPHVAVIIPTYKRPHLLGRAIRSVQNQTFTDLELLIVDDGGGLPPDLHVAASRLRTTVISRPNGGPAAARNAGLRASDSHYVAYLDDDDEWLPHHLSHLVKILQETPRLRIAYSTAQVVDHGQHIRWWGAEPFDKFIADGFYTIFPPSVCVHERSLVSDAGGFDENPLLIGPEDCEFILRISDWAVPLPSCTLSVTMHRDESMTREPRAHWVDTLQYVMAKNAYYTTRRNWLMYFRAYVAACMENRPEYAARWERLLEDSLPPGTRRVGMHLQGTIQLDPDGIKAYCRACLSANGGKNGAR